MVTNAEYLDQIAAENRALNSAGKKIGSFTFTPNMIKWGIIGLVATVFIFIIGILLGNTGGSRELELLQQISLRSTNVSKSISTYKPKIKSSNLRSMGNSLSSVLSETNLHITAYIAGNYSDNDKKPSETLAASEAEFAAALNNSLEVARLSGHLDRVYPREITYQISMLLSLESELYARTNSDQLKSYLASSTSNLNALLAQFEAYSNPSD